jgi:4-alpha-glucanotransferase
MERQSPLRSLADRVGILPEYVDQTGAETRVTSDRTRIEILRRMGIEAGSHERASAALDDLERLHRERLLAPVRVARAREAGAGGVVIGIPPEESTEIEWSLLLVTEAGEQFEAAGRGRTDADGALRLPLPHVPPEGYHRVAVEAGAGHRHWSSEQSLIVVPDRAPSVRELTGRDRVFGITANLYTVRSEANWGIGDVSDLGRLLEWTAEVGGAFVGINPLHALRNRGMDVSPYSPVSRIFRNAIYIDVAAVPELEGCAEARRILESAGFAVELGELRAGDRVEYERVLELKRSVLQVLHRHFHERVGSGSERFAAYRRFRERHGELLTLFAAFEALSEHFGSADWQQWPTPYRDPGSEAVEDFRREHAGSVELHAWLQFELDRQLGEAAARAGRAGLPIGVYQDLAIGTSPSSADVWARPQLFLNGIGIGAPPDDYSATGQNWGLAPLDPRQLREDGYRYWIHLLRSSFRHAGALRIDHAMGLFRQFWIPHGMEGREGAYVRFPADDLLGILALEARRHGALVVGEDLGTVPPEVPPSLHQRGILSSRIFYFERDDNRFRAADRYEPAALTTANTHDLPTLAGFWQGRDIEIKRRLGMIESDEQAEQQRRTRERERQAVLDLLAAEGVLPEAAEPGTGAELRGAIHGFLCRTPSALVGFSLDDLVGETEPVNVPGVTMDRIASWTRKLNTSLEQLDHDPGVAVALRCDGR